MQFAYMIKLICRIMIYDDFLFLMLGFLIYLLDFQILFLFIEKIYIKLILLSI